MKTVFMAIAIIMRDDQILLRQMDPAKNPYTEPWGLFGGRLDGDGTVQDLLNSELKARWNMTVQITERLWWGEDQKQDHDGEEKLFIYIDARCSLDSGRIPNPVNPNEHLEWVRVADLAAYSFNPPSQEVLKKLGYLH